MPFRTSGNSNSKGFIMADHKKSFHQRAEALNGPLMNQDAKSDQLSDSTLLKLPPRYGLASFID